MEINKGDKVVTSGLGGIFPKGILIGEISEVTTEDFGLTKMAYIRPSADFSMLEKVMIAKRSATVIDGADGEGTNADLTNNTGIPGEGED